MTHGQDNTTQLQAILDRAPANQREAYNELLGLASQRLLKLTRKMFRSYPRLRRWEETDDVFQTAAMRLYRSLAEVQPESVRGFFGLAATQIRRTLIDLARHHYGPRGDAARHDSRNGALESQPAITDRPESLDVWAEFHQAVDLLPGEAREVFELLWYKGLEQKQVASLLEISLPTVQRRWYKARHLLNESMRRHIHSSIRGQ